MWRLPYERALMRLYGRRGRYCEGSAVSIRPEVWPDADPAVQRGLAETWMAEQSLQIRRQHRLLFSLVQTYLRTLSANCGKTVPVASIEGILAAAEANFAAEECFLQAVGSRELESHRSSHRAIVAEMSELRRQLQAGAVPPRLKLSHAMDSLLVHHVREEIEFPVAFA